MFSYSFVYSNNIKYRISRHVIFWLMWFVFFVFAYSFRRGYEFISYTSFLQFTIIEMAILLSVDVLFCYALIYMLLPKFLLTGKYLKFILSLLLFLLLDASLSSFLYTHLVNPLRQIFHLPVYGKTSLTDFLIGLNGTLMITGIATTIKLLKLREVKDQEIELLKSEKINVELQFINTYIQPSFLPVLLKKIYSYSFSSYNKVPEMLDKLHRIITYLIDECNTTSVLLFTEIERIQDFIQLEKLTNPERLNIAFELRGSITDQRIVPFILFPMVENNFKLLSANITDTLWVNLMVDVEGQDLVIELKNSKPIETSNLLNYETYNLQQIRKRLELLYPGSYNLSIQIEDQLFIIRLEMDLSKAIN